MFDMLFGKKKKKIILMEDPTGYFYPEQIKEATTLPDSLLFVAHYSENQIRKIENLPDSLIDFH